SFTDYVWRDGFKEWYKIVALSEFHLVTSDDDKTNVVREIPENVLIQKPVTQSNPVDKKTQTPFDNTPPPHPDDEVTVAVTRKVRSSRTRKTKSTSLAQVARTTFTEYFFSLNQVQRGAVVGAGLLGFVSIVVIVSVISSFADRKNQVLA